MASPYEPTGVRGPLPTDFCHHGPVRRLGYVAVRRLALEILGWTLVVVGFAALFLPGPGLLMLFSGMLVLSRQYEWIEKRLDPVKRLAMEGASRGVQSWPRVVVSLVGVAWLMGLGALWGEHPPAPRWWTFSPDLWFVGGWGTGATLIFSGGVALALLVYSFRRFRGNPYDHRAELEKECRRHAQRRLARRERARDRTERARDRQEHPRTARPVGPGITPG